MNKVPNRQAICEVLMEQAKEDKDIVVLCSDSRGSASLAPFAKEFPGQFVEAGIAEQNLVSIGAGLAKCGKKVFAASPASFVSTRSYEQAKVDCAYSDTNVTLVGISGGVSYGALGMSHHSAQDIAAMSAIPNMRVYLRPAGHAGIPAQRPFPDGLPGQGAAEGWETGLYPGGKEPGGGYLYGR